MGKIARHRKARWSGWRVTWAVGLTLTAGCGELPRASEASIAAPPPGQARIWFYRDWQPSESLNLANIDVNGSYFGSVANGNAFYRDVPPGQYHIAPQSYGRDNNQDSNVDLAPGQQIYVKILSLRTWVEGNRFFERDTFYARLIPPETARVEIAQDRNGI